MKLTLPPQNPAVGDGNALRQISNAVREALKGNIVFQNAVHLVPKLITDADSPFSPVGTCFISADASGGVITIDLPPAATASGYVYFIKKADSGANAVTLDGDGAETIDGSATKVLSSAWASTIIISDGTQWLTF